MNYRQRFKLLTSTLNIDTRKKKTLQHNKRNYTENNENPTNKDITARCHYSTLMASHVLSSQCDSTHQLQQLTNNFIVEHFRAPLIEQLILP